MRYIHQAYKEGAIYPKPILSDFSNNMYWSRSQCPEKKNIIFFDLFTPVDIYLMAANPAERIPIQTFLSYRGDFSLQQLRGMTFDILNRYGYLVPEPSDMTLVTYHSPHGLNIETFRLTSLRIEKTPSAIPIHPLALLRLYFTYLASQELIPIPEQLIKTFKPNELTMIYRSQLTVGFPKPEDYQLSFDPERIGFPCLICQRQLPDTEFPWCGHGICRECQMRTGKVTCSFCHKHFVCDSLSDQDIPKEGFSNPQIEQIRKASDRRSAIFDFINSKVKPPARWLLEVD